LIVAVFSAEDVLGLEAFLAAIAGRLDTGERQLAHDA